MHSSYLKNFDKLFFNVENYTEIKENIDYVSSVLDLLITKFGEIQTEIICGILKDDYPANIVIMSFIRKIMGLLDAINVLYSVGSFEPTQIILRTLIESICELKFILKENTPKRAAAYYLEYHYQQLDKVKKIRNTESEFKKQLIAQNGTEEFDKYCEELEQKRQTLKRLIKSKPVFQEIDTSREKKLKEKKEQNRYKKRVYIQWYEVCSNVKNMYGLMKEIGYEKYYDSTYNGLSFETHGLNVATGINVDENNHSLKLIRDITGGENIFNYTRHFSNEILQDLYKYLGWEKTKTLN